MTALVAIHLRRDGPHSARMSVHTTAKIDKVKDLAPIFFILC